MGKCGPQQRKDGETILSVSPNPFRSTVSISGIPEESEGVDIVLYEIATGRRMKSLRISSSNSQLDLSEVPHGIYLITYKQNGKSESLKIIKQ